MNIFITGMIGSGKSEALEILKHKGFHTFDLDKITHDLYKKGQEGYKALTEYYGFNIVAEDKSEIDRNKLRALTLLKKKYKKNIQKIIQPLIYNHLKEELINSKEMFFIEASTYWQNEKIYKNISDYIIEIRGPISQSVKKVRQKFELTESKAIKYVEKLSKYHKKKSKRAYSIVENYGDLQQLSDKLLKTISTFK